jgi:hypothetical protein
VASSLDARIAKAHAIRCQPVKVRRVNFCVARCTQSIVPQIVGNQKENVRKHGIQWLGFHAVFGLSE